VWSLGVQECTGDCKNTTVTLSTSPRPIFGNQLQPIEWNDPHLETPLLLQL
jgi:hypothetical protein